MKVLRESIKNSPYLGIFCTATEETILIPEHAEQKQAKKIQEAMEAEAIRASIAESSLLGVLCKGNKNGFIIPEIAEKQELKKLEEQGIKVKVLKGNMALGNLIACNDTHAVISPIIPKKQREEIAKFLKVETVSMKIAGTEICGSSLVITNKGFLVNPNASKSEFEKLKKFLKLEGNATTANYGDKFVGNSIIANSKAVIAGSLTTNIELIRIQEGMNA